MILRGFCDIIGSYTLYIIHHTFKKDSLFLNFCNLNFLTSDAKASSSLTTSHQNLNVSLLGLVDLKNMTHNKNCKIKAIRFTITFRD